MLVSALSAPAPVQVAGLASGVLPVLVQFAISDVRRPAVSKKSRVIAYEPFAIGAAVAMRRPSAS